MLFSIFACLVWIECQPAEIPFYLEVQGESRTERYACWRGENQQCYVFLPGYADFSKSRVVLNTGDPLYLDGKVLNEETDCSVLQENHVYALTYCGLLGEQQLGLTFIKSGAMPVIHIDTESGKMDYVHGKKGNEEKADIRIYSYDGELICSDTLKSIAARGNSTFIEEKKPYIIKFSEPHDILGMGASEKWLLLANALDPTNLRNHIAMGVAEKMGFAYTPQMQWAELYLNQEYVGLYLLCEKIEVCESRLDIPRQGSYLFSLEDRGRVITQNLPHYETTTGQVLRIRYPDVLDESSEAALAAVIQRAENAILSENGIDPDSGAAWNDLIDVDSWARKYLIEEIFANIDAGKWSQYFYVSEEDGKIFAGPAWDYDLSMAISWQTSISNTWYCSRLTPNGDPIAPWFEALSRKPEFMCRVVQIYETEVLPLMLELLDEGIPQSEKFVAQSSAINALRWGKTESPEGNVEKIKNYLQERIRFLNDIWIEGNEYIKVTAYLGDADGYTDLMLPVDASMDALPSIQEEDFLGWYWQDDDTPVESNVKAEDGMQIYALRTESHQVDERLMKLIPLAVIAMMGLILVVIEIYRLKNKRWYDRD